MVKNTKNKPQIVSKEELINRIQEKTEKKKNEIKEIVDSFLETVNETLISGEEVRLMGSFTLRTDLKAKSKAMNLQTKKPIVVPAHYVPKCKFSMDLKKRIRERKVK